MPDTRSEFTYISICKQIHVGAGLPAMQATRSVSCTEVMLSQASQLPHLTRSGI
ncbi:hypothetical protein [Pseudomonas sp. 52 E 6]|nr:hypothetical protein [Pseudomonas sp. 58 R 12]CRM27054.1 hypothetical protein [Pseudomonas sp. 35 E 8]CRM42914.1 hypothetical protein [Pseudomonas sp. 52 E 6]